MLPVLITGEMRSGTTFLANFLNSQDDVLVHADILVTLFREAHELQIVDIHKRLSKREKNVLFNNLIQEGKNNKIDFNNINRNEELSWKQLFDEALLSIKGNVSTQIVGIKRTREEKFLKQLLDDGVKVIYLVRDPRDVILSARNRFSKFNLFGTVDKWKKSVNNAFTLKKHTNFFFLRYEDLILDKEKIAGELSDFLGVEVKTEFEVFKYKTDLTYLDNSSFGDIQKLFDPSAVYRWKKRLDFPEAGFCSELLEKELSTLNYELYLHSDPLTVESKKLISDYKKAKKKALLKSMIKRMAGSFFE